MANCIDAYTLAGVQRCDLLDIEWGMVSVDKNAVPETRKGMFDRPEELFDGLTRGVTGQGE